jgi:hypothetical protein
MGGGITKDATVRVGLEVDDDVATAADRILGPIDRAAQSVHAKLGAVASETGRVFANVAMDVARVATALGTVDLAASVARFVRYREEVARTAASTGQSFDALGQKYKTVGDRLAISDEAVSRFSRGMQIATYDASDSSRAIEALGNEALLTNRSLDQMAPIGEALHNELGQSFDDIPDALGRIDAAAEKLGTSGGPAALQTEIASLGATISQVSIKSRADFANIAGSIAEIGRGLPAKQQERVQQRIVGRIFSDTEGLRRQLGVNFEQFYDEQGKVRDFPALLQRVQQMAVKRWGLHAREVLSQPQNFGPEGAAAIMGYDPDAARTAAETRLSTTAAERRRSFRQSSAGESIAERYRAEEAKRDQIGSAIAKGQDWIGSLFEGHPLLGHLAMMTGVQLGGAGLKWLFTPRLMQAAAGALGGGEGLAIGGGALSKISPAVRLGAGAFRWLLSGSAGSIATGALALSALTTYGGIKMTGLDKFNETIGAQRNQLEQQLETARIGRVYAILRAAERSSTVEAGGFSSERYRRELGPRLMGEIAQDPALQLVASGAANGAVPAGLGQQAPALAAALRDALKEIQLNVQVQLQDDSGSPHRVVARQKGAHQ